MSARVPGLDVRIVRERPFRIEAEFTCAAGELLALGGPSGSGKTTLLRLIAGLERGDAGHVRCGGADWFDGTAGLDLPPEKRRVGMVFQDYALFPHLSAVGNLEIAMGHLPRAARPARAHELLALVNLDGLGARRPAALSGGQRQRVAIARALARDPAVLLFDEPFAAVDQQTRAKLYRELAQLRRTLELPMVLVTHDMLEVMQLADSLAVVHRGRTLQRGPVREVMSRPRDVRVARLLGHRNLLPARVARLHEGTCELALERVEPDRPARSDVADPIAGADAMDATRAAGTVRSPRVTLSCPSARVPEALRAPGQPLVLLVPRSAIVLHRRDRPSRGEAENPLDGHVVEALAFGDEVALRVTLAGVGAQLGFRLSLHVATRNGIERGVGVTLSIIAEALHAMPRPAGREASGREADGRDGESEE